MERRLILLVAALMVYVAPVVQGTAHLSFANNTQVNITRRGCGVTKRCLETPFGCDPTGNTSCLFSSVVPTVTVAPISIDLSIQLRGDSMGYIALGLTANVLEGTTMLFICAQNRSDNGKFFFRTVSRNNTDATLTPTERRVTEIRGQVNGSVIQCEFNIPNVNATNIRTSQDTTLQILLGTGEFDGNTLGPFNITLKTAVLNLTNLLNNMAPTPAPSSNSTTTGSSGPALHPHAVLLLLSVLSLTVLLRP